LIGIRLACRDSEPGWTRTAVEPECLQGGRPQSFLIVFGPARELDELAGDELRGLGFAGEAKLTADIVEHDAHGFDGFGPERSVFEASGDRHDTLQSPGASYSEGWNAGANVAHGLRDVSRSYPRERYGCRNGIRRGHDTVARGRGSLFMIVERNEDAGSV
jgi:hypothetical protein